MRKRNVCQLGVRLRDRLAPSRGQRPGRPTDHRLTIQRKVSMTAETLNCLEELAEAVCTTERHVSSMQVASQLLEEVVKEYSRKDVA